MEKTKTVKYTISIEGEVEIPAGEEWDRDFVRDTIFRDYYDNGLSIRNISNVEWEV